MPLPVIFDSIPDEIKRFPNWVLWRLEERDGKNTKIPYQRNGKKADTTNPDTWDKYDYIVSTRVERDGIGFVFSEDTGIIGIDWDKVRDPETGEWDEEILEEIKSLNSYAELSQSGTGAHVLIKGTIPGTRRRKGNIEMYSKERFFVVTGQHVEGTPKEIKENQEAINKLYEKRFGADKKEEKKGIETANEAGKKTRSPKMTDDEVLDHCRKAANSKKFIKLYDDGAWKEFQQYDTASDARLALYGIIVFYTQDFEQIKRIFSKSKLAFDDWERKFKYDAEKALSDKTEFFTGKSKSGKKKPEKILVHFDEVGNRILKENHIFSMRDSGDIYLYNGGVYRSEGTEAILGTEIRQTYFSMFIEKWKRINPDFDLPEHIPKATVRYVNEVLAYIKAYTHIPREIIDIFQERYINFKNCLFNLDKWEFEDHNPGIKTICQIPVNYDKSAECPQINSFIKDVAKPEDIAFLEEWAGYCLTTDVSYQKALMLYGIPGTGKSVFATMLETFIGGENSSSESLQKIEEDKYRAAKLYGKRVNICSDIPSTKMHKTEVFKKLVSGLDTIDAENKYEDPFKFKNKAKLTFSANKIPEGPKDPAFYERFCLIEFGNKFRGTDKDDKKLIQKLTTDTELSGFLNIALEGLRRLYKNDKFSYNKTFEETEREYIINSNPVAFFMEECTISSPEDIESTILYLSYVDWSNKNNKQRVSNIEFSRRLSKMGYTNHRENVKSDGSKKVTFWDNIRLKTLEEIKKEDEEENKKDDFGQDPGQDQNNRSCPKNSSQLIPENLTKIDFGQDLIPCVSFATQNNQSNCDNIETVKAVQNEENKKTSNTLNTSCPSVRFFDSGEYGQDVLNDPVLDPVQEQKTPISKQQKDDDIIKKLDYMGSFRRDLKNLVHSKYNSTVESIPELLEDFNRRNPGYRQVLGEQALLDEAEKINKWGWN